jgi:4'-phosphopantetheinyl transferase
MLTGEHVRVLDAVERDRATSYAVESDRERFTLGAAVVRLAAGPVLGIDPERLEVDRRCSGCGGPHGRPRIVGSGLHVSVSHSADRVAVAVTSVAPVGIDVEHVTELDTADLSRKVLGPSEVAVGTRDFLRCWTRKESVVKATGSGLATRLPDVVVSRPSSPARLVSCPGLCAAGVSMHDVDPGPGYVGCLTVLAPTMPTVEHGDAAELLGSRSNHRTRAVPTPVPDPAAR